MIFVNGEVAKTALFIYGNETITLKVPQKNTNKKVLNLDLEVVYEDDHLAVINKPAGILVSGNTFKTIDSALLQNLNINKNDLDAKPSPIHRLDYPTTGVLLVGKTKTSILKLNKLFSDKEIKKKYYAVTIGKMEATGVINISIDDKDSESYYKVIKIVTSKRFKYLNLVELTPKTGRRHQLRKHLSTIGNPILGDKKYGKEDLILKGKGLYLHAYSLEFTHPISHKKICIKKELPSKFVKLFGRL